MTLYEVWMKFLTFFTGGATVAPEIIQLIGLGMTLATIYTIFIYPMYRIMRGRK